MRLQLARALMCPSDLMLLDEPTNHLDVTNVAWLVNYLTKEIPNVTCMIVSHDAGFLNDCCTDILQIDRLKLHQFRGNLDKFIAQNPDARAYFSLKEAKLKFKFPQPGPIAGVKSRSKALMKITNCTFTYPGNTVPNTVFDALAASPKPPKTVAFVTSKFPSIHFLSLGAREVAKKRGLQEVLFLEWDFGNRDFGPIAARIKDAKPDMVWVGDIALEGNMLLDAMKKIDYTPPLHFHLYPAPGPMSKAADGNNALAVTIFEEHAPFTTNPVAANFVQLDRNGDGAPSADEFRAASPGR